jgi:hypothetical protein
MENIPDKTEMIEIETITLPELEKMAYNSFGDMVKGVVDINKGLLVLDAELHVDIEQYLLEQGSQQRDLWGINLYPALHGADDFVEFDSMINIRPRQNNRSRDVEDESVRLGIRALINRKIKE